MCVELVQTDCQRLRYTGKKNQIACDPPLTAASLSEWCNEEKKIFPFQSLNEDFGTTDEGAALGDVKRARGAPGEERPLGCVHRSSTNSCIMRAGKSCPHPGEISSLLQATLHREKLEHQDAKAFASTELGSLERAACEQGTALLLAMSLQPAVKIWAF